MLGAEVLAASGPPAHSAQAAVLVDIDVAGLGLAPTGIAVEGH
jgi:hypothetical protein